MKKYLITISLIGALAFGSCNDLDVAPRNIISEQTLLSSEAGIESYVATCYSNIRHDNWEQNFLSWAVAYTSMDLSGETAGSFWWPADGRIGDFNQWNNSWAFWTYSAIRNCNVFIDKFDQIKGNFTENMAKHYLGEIYFIRAFHYFQMAKRYGGLPLVGYTMNMDMAEDETFLPRSSEYDTWKFICDDFQRAADLMQKTNSAGPSRATKGAALGMLSRAALYAGTIAKYNSKLPYYKWDGNEYQGIDPSKAKEFLTMACKAAVDCKECGFTLEGDYAKMFNSYAGAMSNSEFMFVKQYVIEGSGGGHSMATLSAPQTPVDINGFYDIGTFNNPTYDWIQYYEDLDGTHRGFDNRMFVNGEDATAGYKEYEDPADFFDGKDKRLAASVILPFSKYYGYDIVMRKGLRMSNGTEVCGDINAAYSAEDLASVTADGYKLGIHRVNGVKKYTETAFEKGLNLTDNGYGRTIGAYDGPNTVVGKGFNSGTGFYLRKYTDDSRYSTLTQWTNDYPSVDLRYAEVLLNLAEAAIELVDLGDNSYAAQGLSAINEVRGRAGLKDYTNTVAQGEDLGCYSIASTRAERNVELAFEFHAAWDQKRWRTMVDDWDGRVKKALWPMLDYTDNVYYFKVGQNWPTYPWTFDARYYYLGISSSVRNTNPNITQNYGY